MVASSDPTIWSAKPYSKAQDKLRCVLAIDFYPDAGQRPIVDGLKKAGVPYDEIIVFCEDRLSESPDPVQLIDASLNFTFTCREEYNSGRFNTKSFPALYTAKEQRTAALERKHYLTVYESDNIVPAVLFSVEFSGVLADLRPGVQSGDIPFADDYGECHKIAEKVFSGDLDGIAAPSFRSSGGNCCAIYRRDKVRALCVEREIPNLHEFYH